MILTLTLYLIINFVVSSLFSESLFIITKLTQSWRQNIFFQRNLTTVFASKLKMTLILIQLNKTHLIMIKSIFSFAADIWTHFTLILYYKIFNHVKCKDSFFREFFRRWHISQLWTYFLARLYKFDYQYQSAIFW